MVMACAFYTVDADKGPMVTGLTLCVNQRSWWDPAGSPFRPEDAGAPHQQVSGAEIPACREPGGLTPAGLLSVVWGRQLASGHPLSLAGKPQCPRTISFLSRKQLRGWDPSLLSCCVEMLGEQGWASDLCPFHRDSGPGGQVSSG